MAKYVHKYLVVCYIYEVLPKCNVKLLKSIYIKQYFHSNFIWN